MSSQADTAPARQAGWHKSSRSNPSQNCVEIRVDGTVARIRDSKNTLGPMIACARASFAALVDWIRHSEPAG
jgi:hypothetical protein